MTDEYAEMAERWAEWQPPRRQRTAVRVMDYKRNAITMHGKNAGRKGKGGTRRKGCGPVRNERKGTGARRWKT